MITDAAAAAEAVIAIARGNPMILMSGGNGLIGQSITELAEQIYTDDPVNLSAELLAEEIINRLGYCFTRIGGKLVVED